MKTKFLLSVCCDKLFNFITHIFLIWKKKKKKVDRNLLFKRIFSVFTRLLFVCAGILAFCWIITEQEFESYITFILILAGFLGIFVDRWLKLRETRKSLLIALAHELFENMQVILDPIFSPDSKDAKKFVVFPRLSHFAVEATIISSAFTSKKDRELFNLLYSCLERSKDFNKRLDITEIVTVKSPPTDIKIWRETLKEGVTFSQFRKSLAEISNHLLKYYKNESGIDENTVLFA